MILCVYPLCHIVLVHYTMKNIFVWTIPWLLHQDLDICQTKSCRKFGKQVHLENCSKEGWNCSVARYVRSDMCIYVKLLGYFQKWGGGECPTPPPSQKNNGITNNNSITRTQVRHQKWPQELQAEAGSSYTEICYQSIVFPLWIIVVQWLSFRGQCT